MNQLTREMTAGELKFALQAEQVLNSVPQPEYRQLIVESLMVLTLLVHNVPSITNLGKVINVEQLVHRANRIFLEEQVQCGSSKGDHHSETSHSGNSYSFSFFPPFFFVFRPNVTEMRLYVALED